MVKASNKGSPTIFIVDDDLAVRDSLKFLLELEGFRVRTYADGEALLNEPDKVEDEDACLVIDQVMPGMSGLQIIDTIRQRGGLNPVILMVSEPNSNVKKAAAARGVAVVEKPFLQQTLIDAICKAMGLTS